MLPAQERFSGRTQIRVQLTEASDQIWLHGKDLHVTEVWARSEAEPIRGIYQQENSEGLANIHFERELPMGEQLIELRYDAPFNQQLQGLYHVQTEGESYAFTQFESISARLAFPCFDEPAFKTPFDIWLTVATDHQALSNTRAAQRRAGQWLQARAFLADQAAADLSRRARGRTARCGRDVGVA